jgi:Ribbon-helix-helix domain
VSDNARLYSCLPVGRIDRIPQVVSDGPLKTKLKQEAVYLMPEKHELLLELAKKTRISRSELLREAVDDLLKKHGVLKVARRKLYFPLRPTRGVY